MKIAILTSGGDAPGMNAAIRAVVRYAKAIGLDAIGVRRGYAGILAEDFVKFDAEALAQLDAMIDRGGTFLQTGRCPEFLETEPRLRAGEILRRRGVDSLIVLGGDGSFRGAADLARDTGIRVAGIPATIDNDLAYTDYTLGFDTAVNNVLWSLSAIRDTMDSHNKPTVVEVMGRHCGDIALYAGLTAGADFILLPEVPFDMNEIAARARKKAEKGECGLMIVLAEGAGTAADVAAQYKALTGIEARQTVLGFIQRGGTPTHRDRLLATRLAMAAVAAVAAGRSDRVVGIRRDEVVELDLFEALAEPRRFNHALYRAASVLA